MRVDGLDFFVYFVKYKILLKIDRFKWGWFWFFEVFLFCYISLFSLICFIVFGIGVIFC